MAYFINEDCVACGLCETECEPEAITPGKDRYSVDPDKCSDCTICTELCPVGAINPE